jgi:hypothetical protein
MRQRTRSVLKWIYLLTIWPIGGIVATVVAAVVALTASGEGKTPLFISLVVYLLDWPIVFLRGTTFDLLGYTTFIANAAGWLVVGLVINLRGLLRPSAKTTTSVAPDI